MFHLMDMIIKNGADDKKKEQSNDRFGLINVKNI